MIHVNEMSKLMIHLFRCRYVRDCDRKMNHVAYPSLHYPEMYVLQGGYKAFFEKFESLCDPQKYLPMSDANYINECRHFRGVSKSASGRKKSLFLGGSRLSSTKKLNLDDL